MAGILNAIQLSSRGLSVQRAKMNTVAKNIANAETTATEEGGPYRRQRVIVSEDAVKGGFNSYLKTAGDKLNRTDSRHLPSKVRQSGKDAEYTAAKMKVVEDPKSEVKLIYDPSHPDANEEGYVEYPDIEIVNEMVDMMAASRAYEANTVAIATAKKMAEEALDI